MKFFGWIFLFIVAWSVLGTPESFPVIIEQSISITDERLQQLGALFAAEFRARPDIREVDRKEEGSYRVFFRHTHHNDIVTVGIVAPYDSEATGEVSWQRNELTEDALREAARKLPIPRCRRDFPLPETPLGPREASPEVAADTRRAAALWAEGSTLSAANIAEAAPWLRAAMIQPCPDPDLEWCMYRVRSLTRADFAAFPPEAQQTLRELLNAYVASRGAMYQWLEVQATAPWQDKSGRLRRVAARARRLRELWRAAQCEWDYRIAAATVSEELNAYNAEAEAAIPALTVFFNSRSRRAEVELDRKALFDNARVDFFGFYLNAPPGDYAEAPPEEKAALEEILNRLAASPFYPVACAGIEGLFRLEGANGDAAKRLYQRWRELFKHCPDFPAYATYEPPMAAAAAGVLSLSEQLSLMRLSSVTYRNYTLFLDGLEAKEHYTADERAAVRALFREMMMWWPPDDPAVTTRYEQLSQRLDQEELP